MVEKAESLQDGTAASSELALFLSLQQAFLSSLSGSAGKGDVNRKFGAAKHLNEKIAKTGARKIEWRGKGMRPYVSFTSLDPSFWACFLPNSFGKVRNGRFLFLKKSQHCASPNREGVYSKRTFTNVFI